MQRASRQITTFLTGEKTLDRRTNLGMKMDHTRNSTDIVPKGQYVICAQKVIYLLSVKQLSVTFLELRKFPKQLDGCLLITTNTKGTWKVFRHSMLCAMSVCLSLDWISILVQTRDVQY